MSRAAPISAPTEPSSLLPDSRTLDRARLSRDPRFDGRFFMAVTTTGIYCRPVCPAAPTPKRANIRYFPTAAAAAEAGFRPCLRCRPEAAPGTPAWLGTSAVVRRALKLIQDGALDESSIEQFASRLGIGPRHLHRLFVHHVGASPNAVAQTRRLHFAKRLIDQTRLTMTEIALAAGYGSLRRFNHAFSAAYGRPPRDIRRGSLAQAERHDHERSIVLRLAYRPPYDWHSLREFLAARAVPGVERVDARGYARTIALPGSEPGSQPDAEPSTAPAMSPAIIRVRPLPKSDELELTVSGAPPAALLQISLTARRMFDLAADPALTAQVLGSDPVLRDLLRRRRGLRIPGVWDPFECAVRAVLGQQVSVAAARTLAARLVARAGRPIDAAMPRQPTSAEGLTHLFPSPAALARADLSGLGVTGARIAAIQTLARAVLDGTLDFSAAAEEVVAALKALPGIGAWTAHYIALRALGEPDALLAADIVLRRRAAAGGSPLTQRELEARAEAWRPWRSYAVMHLWRAAAEASARTRPAARSRKGSFDAVVLDPAALREIPTEGAAP
ncbi:MAG: AlkA N-terminal domain-containing protein [Steroidobacteraceae bacterium]